MGYTGVVWESRSTEQLARDLTEGPGPSSVGDAGAAWVRVANGFTAAAAEYTQALDRVRTSWESRHAPEVLARLQELGDWLQAKALNAAANGQRAEQAAVAATVAILAMPSVSEAAEGQAQRDMMASLAAYNGAILTGSFAEFDAAATADQANAAAVMQQYENAVAPLATAWDEPLPPEVAKGDAAAAERAAAAAADGAAGGSAGAGGGGYAPPPMPLGPHTGRNVSGSERPSNGGRVSAVSPAAASTMAGAPYAPMAGLARGQDGGRDHESIYPPEVLEGGGEAAAGLAENSSTWLPATGINDTPILLDSVSWGPDTAAFDGLADPGTAPEEFAEDARTLEQVSDSWVSPAVIGKGVEEP
ncbi:PPE domain-containing protein [Mycolicibacterium goodii]|uniref:PPE domain-containing protein n=1 Tax=Mycolicibacterium goodii TaxID=134601 RepID=A0A0K0X2J4_MYCGD|nr:hypothetical protein AFA91_06860 [Mycolicibacterium goodii]